MEGIRKRDKKAVEKGFKDIRDIKKQHKADDEESKHTNHDQHRNNPRKQEKEAPKRLTQEEIQARIAASKKK